MLQNRPKVATDLSSRMLAQESRVSAGLKTQLKDAPDSLFRAFRWREEIRRAWLTIVRIETQKWAVIWESNEKCLSEMTEFKNRGTGILGLKTNQNISIITYYRKESAFRSPDCVGALLRNSMFRKRKSRSYTRTMRYSNFLCINETPSPLSQLGAAQTLHPSLTRK